MESPKNNDLDHERANLKRKLAFVNASEVLDLLRRRQRGESYRHPRNLSNFYQWIFSLRYGEKPTVLWKETPFPAFLGLIGLLNQEQLIDLSASEDVFQEAVSSFDGRKMNEKIYGKCSRVLAEIDLDWAMKCLKGARLLSRSSD